MRIRRFINLNKWIRRHENMIPKRKTQYISLIIPGMLLFSFGVILPAILGLRYSFTSWNGMTREVPWTGLENYRRILQDKYVKDAWGFTIKFTLWNTVLQNLFALLFAILLNSGIKGKNIFRTMLFIPCLISPVIVGFIWQRIFMNILPVFNMIFGTKVNFLLLGRAETVLSGLLIANNWQWIGYWMLIYLAALQSIPQFMYEAAKVDGASKIRQFFIITLPMLAPAFTISIVGITIGSLKVYELLVSATNGGPGRASTSIIYLIYNTAISGRQYGYGSAISMTLIAVLLIVAVIQISFLKKREVQL